MDRFAFDKALVLDQPVVFDESVYIKAELFLVAVCVVLIWSVV